MSAPKVLSLLWAAVTIPVILVGWFLYSNLKQPEPVIVTKTVVVTPTASPSATIVPRISTAAKATIKPVVTIKGGVR